MVSPAALGEAGLQGWRRKVAAAVAPLVASRTGAREEHVRAFVGAAFFALAIVYVVKTVRVAIAQLG